LWQPLLAQSSGNSAGVDDGVPVKSYLRRNRPPAIPPAGISQPIDVERTGSPN